LAASLVHQFLSITRAPCRPLRRDGGPQRGKWQRIGAMDKDYLVLKRASASRPSGEWEDDDYDVFADSIVVGRIMKAVAAPLASVEA
jgi:hypothetical protein